VFNFDSSTHALKYIKKSRVREIIVACNKYFSAEKFSDHASYRRAPALLSGTHLSSLVDFL
jgi:hypothetical protein